MEGTTLHAIEQATLEVFAMMVGIDITPALEAGADNYSIEPKIVSSFTLSGAISGTAKVFYTMPLAKRITSQMLQTDAILADDDILDAAGEVANMIVGNVKNTLESQRGLIHIGTPTVEISYEDIRGDQSATVNFRCFDNVFSVSMAFQEDPSCVAN